MGEIVRHETVGRPVFWVSFILCAGLLVAGFVVPPTGAIDPSVLKGGGLLFAFPTLWTVGRAIDKGLDARLRHGKTEVVIGDLSNETQATINEEEDNE